MRALDHRSAVRLLAVLYLAGSLLGLASMALPQPPGQEDWKIYCVLAVSLAVGVALHVRHLRDSRVVLIAALSGTTVLVTVGIHASQTPESVYALFYVGTVIVAAYALTRDGMLLQVGLVASAYGALLLHERPPGGAERWLVTVGTVLVVGGLVAAMRRRVEDLVSELEATVERLAETASTDALTGLANRRGFDAAVAGELARTRRGAESFALVVVDLDRFKEVNDRHGHPTGDAVLRCVAAALQDSSREIDLVARLGGEEFGILLPATDEDAALAVADRLREAIDRTCRVDDVQLTASAGVAVAREHPTADALMSAADTALYAAKQLGRNRTVAYRSHLPGMLRFESEQAAGEVSPLRTVLALAEALDLRDTGTADHSLTVARHAETMAQELGLAPRHAARLRLAGLLHDVGKIGVPDSALRKTGPLDAEEWRLMRAHPEIGARLLGPVVGDIADWVLCHHERMDGKGYPRGLAAEEIPLEARVLAVADAYEAMTADRPYRAAMDPADAMAELRAGAGTQFDAEVVAIFLRTLEAVAALELPAA